MSLSYQHIFEPGTRTDAPPLLLLHGTGGNERDLLDLGRTLSPGSALLSPRGNVSEHGANRFFARLAESVFDPAEVRRRTQSLATFVTDATQQYQLTPGSLVAVGFSNGANIAATLLQLFPASLGGGVLLRSMVVLDQPAPHGSLPGKHVLLINGEHDPIVPPGHPDRLAMLLRQGGASVTTHVIQGAGHGLTREDLTVAKNFLAAR